MLYKTIFSGNFEFGNERSFDRVIRVYQHRVENYYKSDLLFDLEAFIDQERFSICLTRHITKGSDKSWKNTINLIKLIAQYAVAGSMSAWMVENGKVLRHEHIEPCSEKVAVQSFLQGRELISEKGKEEEAIESLNRAIAKFERHSLAYERRGHINYLLNNFEDAVYDFSKCIDINPNNAEAHLGRAMVHIVKEDYKAAIADLEKAVKKSIPLQPTYWKARRIKSECHIAIEDFDGAIFELKLFTKREFTTDNPNYKWRSKAFFDYGKSLLAVGRHDDAIKAFDNALKVNAAEDTGFEADRLLLRGIALKEAGKSGFKKDWQEAANKGSKRAALMLREVAV